MRKTKRQWNYETSILTKEAYREENGMRADNEEPRQEEYEALDDSGYSYDESYDDDCSEDLENYGNDLSGCIEDDASLDEKKRIEGVMDSAFLLNETDNFSKRPDANQIRDNFRRYVEDAKSGNEAAVQAAQYGACRDLEFFIMSLINRKFSTYIEKDHSFYEDLMQAGRIGIIAALPKYDPDQTMPTTYFFNPIRHEMVQQVNMMKHDTKSHIATTKRKIQEVDRRFAKYGRTPSLHDYAYSIGCPFQRIVNALAEIKAGNAKTSIDDPDFSPLADTQSSMGNPEENAISNMNANKIIQIAYELEPREGIVQCFLESHLGGRVKTTELSEKYGYSPSEITEGIRNLENLLRFHPDMRKMYPEKFRMKEHELSEQIAYMPVEEGRMAMENVLDSLKAIAGNGETLDIVLG